MADTSENPCFKVGPKGMPRLRPKEMTRLYPAIDLACLEKVDSLRCQYSFSKRLAAKDCSTEGSSTKFAVTQAKSKFVHNAYIIQKFIFLYSLSLENQHPHLQESQYKFLWEEKF